MQRYCEACGTGHDCAGAGEQVNAEVEIERLRTKRDIEVARITASAAKDIAETEAEADADHAEGRAEGMETAIEAMTGGGEPPAPEPVPVVVDGAPAADPDPMPGPAVEPPPAPEPTFEPPAAKSAGWWDGYR